MCGPCVEEAIVPTLRRQGDGKRLRRRTQGVHQPTDGEPRESAGHEGQQCRVEIFATEIQEIQQVRNNNNRLRACWPKNNNNNNNKKIKIKQ